MIASSHPVLHKIGARLHELLAAIAFFVLAWGCAPGAWWRDAGQLTASSFSLGVPHPTGFPLYMMMGKLASFIPVGSIAFRMNLLSAVCAAGAVGFIAASASALSKPKDNTMDSRYVASCVAGFSLLFAQPFFLHGTTAEVYAPTALLMGACLWVWTRLRSNEESRPRAILALLTGLGICIHVASFAFFALVLWAGVFVYDLFFPERRTLWKKRGWIWVVAGFITLIAYAYLLLATLHDPWRNWGDPSTLDRLWTHMTAGTIRDAFQADMFDANAYTMQFHVALYWKQLWNALGLLIAFSIAGLVALAHQRKWDVLFIVLGIWVADAFFTVFVNPMGMEDHQTAVPSLLVLCLAGGLGAAEITRSIPRGIGWPRGSAVGALALGAFLFATPALERNRSQDIFPSIYTQEILSSAPPGATLFLSSDDSSGLLSYAIGVEGARPDLSLIFSAHLYDANEVMHWSRLFGNQLISEETKQWIQDVQKREPEALYSNEKQQKLVWEMIGLPPSLTHAPARTWPRQPIPQNWLEGKNPVLWELGESTFDKWVAGWGLLRPGFPFFTLAAPGHTPSLRVESFHDTEKKWEEWAGRSLNYHAKRALADRARVGASGTDTPTLQHSLALARLATHLDPGNHRGWNKLGHFLGQINHWKAASVALRTAVSLRPDQLALRTRLARALRMNGSLKEAKTEAELSLSLAETPREKAKVHGELARIASGQGKKDEMEAELTKMKEAAPDLPGIENWIQQIRLEAQEP